MAVRHDSVERSALDILDSQLKGPDSRRQRRRQRQLLILLLLLLHLSGGAPAAGQQPAPRFRTGVDLVEVALAVHDRDGRPVTDLRAEEVAILENGVRQDIVAFQRISLPVRANAGQPAYSPRDVASNEALGESRVFVLVLDALHVAPRNIAAVRRAARQFLEEHVGPSDFAAVLTPGGAAGATEDFTTDTARLVAAVDRFTATRLRSATVERDEEERLAGSTGIVMHDGRDPSDGERAGRARSLASSLEAVAGHLDRIAGRRKALLLFSEGIDYDIGDVMGVAQRQASDVMRALHQALGTLMRSNVVLYAIDPRALSTAAGEMLEAPVYREVRPDSTISPFGVEQEHAASMRSLRHLAEPTGGFAAVTSNDLAGALDRIVADVSEYYVLGYTPVRPAQPGERRSLDVRVSRAGVRVSARRGYVMPRAAARRVSVDPSFDAPVSVPGAGRGRSGTWPVPAATAADGGSAARGLPDDLRDLLASPLPKAGLPLRVQAVPLGGDSRKRAVHLIVEVLGRDLQFAEARNRFEERVELALLTVDDRGRAANGRSTTIDLRLPPDELERVKATGVRWLSSLDLPAGRHQLRVAARAVRTGSSGLVTLNVDVQRLEPRQLTMSGVTLTSLPAVLMPTRGKPWLEASLPTPPSAARRFTAGDTITAVVEVYGPAAASPPDVIASLEGPHTSTPIRAPAAVRAVDRQSWQAGFTLETSGLVPGHYLLRLQATRAAHTAEQVVPFEVLDAGGR